MAEYNDREKMLKYLKENNTADEWIIGQYNADWIYSFIESQPTADVVEVVRCKDCKFSHEDYFEQVWCRKRFCGSEEIHVKSKNHFCSLGERKENNDNN